MANPSLTLQPSTLAPLLKRHSSGGLHTTKSSRYTGSIKPGYPTVPCSTCIPHPFGGNLSAVRQLHLAATWLLMSCTRVKYHAAVQQPGSHLAQPVPTSVLLAVSTAEIPVACRAIFDGQHKPAYCCNLYHRSIFTGTGVNTLRTSLGGRRRKPDVVRPKRRSSLVTTRPQFIYVELGYP